MKEGNAYLNWFPDWKFRDIEAQYSTHATGIRQAMYESDSPDMPQTVKDDFKYYENEKELFKNADIAPINIAQFTLRAETAAVSAVTRLLA